MKRAIEVGKPICLNSCSTLADGIAVAKAGDKTFEIIKKYVDDIITVSEDNIVESILFLLEKSKIVAEGAGATSLAGLLSHKIDVRNKNVCCIISGGNIDINNIEKIVNKAQIIQGRRMHLTIKSVSYTHLRAHET